MQLIPEHFEVHLTIKIEFLHIIKPLVLNLILPRFFRTKHKRFTIRK